MSERKSTPGPWRVHDEFVLAGGEGRGGRVIAMNQDRVHYECEPETDANSILLASAPELADALRELHDFATGKNFWPFWPAESLPVERAAELLKRVGY